MDRQRHDAPDGTDSKRPHGLPQPWSDGSSHDGLDLEDDLVDEVDSDDLGTEDLDDDDLMDDEAIIDDEDDEEVGA